MVMTRLDLEKGFKQIGISRGDIVEVHTSLSRLGWVDGGAATVVAALISAVGEEGTLMMSAYPVSKPLPLSDEEKGKGILAKVRFYNLDYEGPTGMGMIADEFRRHPGTVLGPGFHRVCAWGHQAELFSEGYQRLLEYDGLVLLIGVGIESCSCMHQAERAGFPPEVTRCFEVPEDIRQGYPESIHLAYGSTPDNAWEKVRETAEDRGLIQRCRIGQADCMLFKARPVVAIYESALCTEPLELFGLQ